MKNLTLEDRILGRTEPLSKTEFQEKSFDIETKYLVHAEGNNNVKTVGGNVIERLLSFDDKEKVLNGVTELVANGLVIKRIIKETVEEDLTTEETVDELETIEETVKETKTKRKRKNNG